MNIPWPVVKDVFWIALVLQLILSVAGHFVGFLGRYLVPGEILISLLVGFGFGVSASPASPPVSALGGAIVTAGSALAGVLFFYFLNDAKLSTIGIAVVASAAAGAVTGAVGRIVGRSVFG